MEFDELKKRVHGRVMEKKKKKRNLIVDLNDTLQ